MSYCPNCGRQILDERLGCPVCSVRNNVEYSKSVIDGEAAEIQAEKVDSFTVEDRDGTFQRFENRQTIGERAEQQTQPVPDKNIPLIIKILILISIFMFGFLGSAAGILGALALKKSPYESYRRFGKTLMIFSIVDLFLSIGIGILFMIVGGLMNVVGHGVMLLQ